MKSIDVVAAIIKKDDRILATQRGYGDLKGGWEFPGGKVEPNETPEHAIVREIHEELEATIEVERFVTEVHHDYDSFHLDMKCYLCSLDDSITLLEHSAARWLDTEHLRKVDWLPADIKVVEAIEEQRILR